ncbi:hypothetical protein A9179_16590 [Pseudomonas alcaligenes]|uniref:Uncharacterized protein n=2 Tax=Aquipseudomonas alcaligenes TaxID=43263 RepID=A0ABR7S2U2_AQUAC|nr:hypothetical protein [Pseudomonas alcaligenes]
MLLVLAAPLAQAASGELDAYRLHSREALEQLQAERDGAGDSPRAQRDRAILAVVRAPQDGLDEANVEVLANYREQHPDDLYAKLYEGYGRLFSAGEYVKQQNYFRAAELAKRGFFLMDEAVDQAPEDWRLHFLRARLDCYVPAEFGRHVVALKDLRYLQEQAASVPVELAPLGDFLRSRALARDGQDEQARALRQQLAGNPLWAAVLDQGDTRLFLTEAEIRYVLAPIVEDGQ